MHRALALVLALAGPAGACTIDPLVTSAYPESEVRLAGDAQVTRAWFDGPVMFYDHFVLGRRDEPSVLWVQMPPGSTSCGLKVDAGEGHVFEDLAPRLADLDGDGVAEVVVVRSSVHAGAQLAVYGVTGGGFGLVAATDPIGQPNRWLAPAGIADFDGDGRGEVAYVDRPHLRGEIVFVRLEGARLVEVARAGGVSNHRIGEAVIEGGVRDCGAGPELVVPDFGHGRLVGVALQDGQVVQRDLGQNGPARMRRALACG